MPAVAEHTLPKLVRFCDRVRYAEIVRTCTITSSVPKIGPNVRPGNPLIEFVIDFVIDLAMTKFSDSNFTSELLYYQANFDM